MSFFRRNKERMVVTLVAIILVIIIGLTSKERKSLTKIEIITGNILTPINNVINIGSKNIYDFFAELKDIGNLKEKNHQLTEKVAILEEENRKQANIIGKTDFLKNEAKLLENTNFTLISARVVGKEPGNWFDRFTIDKGTNDGIKKGDTVIQGIEIDGNMIKEGIIGRVVDVGDNWAKIVTVIDKLSKISFSVIRTQDGGIISGNAKGEVSGDSYDDKGDLIKGYLYDNKADLIKGDKLITSGLGGSYVENIYIGEVEAVISDDEDLMKRILVKPAIDFKKLYKVYIISEGNGEAI